jgi:3-hydroxyisobutyrate dehydrogenase
MSSRSPLTRDAGTVGLVGLGVMGTPMAGHLADAGHLGAVYDVDADTVAAFVGRRCTTTAASSPAELARSCDVVVTMLPDGQVVQDVVLGTAGLIEGLAPGSLLVDTSSSQPWLTKQTAAALAERGVAMVDAPVSGARWGAEAAELVFMVGGAEADVDRARPLLEILGRAVFHLGPLGSGHIMKSINNTVTAMTLQATLEGLALGVRAGLDPRQMNGVFNGSTAQSWITRTHIDQRILSGTYDDPFRLALMRKDIDIATGLADQLGLDLPMAALSATTYRAADEDAGPGSSLSEIGHWIERHTGVTIRG